MNKRQRIKRLVLLAKIAQIDARKAKDKKKAEMVSYCRGNRDALLLAARLEKGFETQARDRNLIRRAA